jgi:MYXO-CTERM domain-containing protein
VFSNVRVVPVMWGSSVPSDVQSTMPNFYAAVTTSALYDMLTEYDTNILDYAGNQGTNQHIGHGTATKAIVITPSLTSTSITDAQIQSELQSQITAGHLPAPDGNTYYAIAFPAGLSISLPDGNGGTATSCQQFCAYHGTISHTPTNIMYGVLPNVTTDGCQLGCGANANGIDNVTEVASHELVEATTDAAVGLATNNAPPLAWYDPQGQDGEIGDICNGTSGSISVGGTSYVVQLEWSNSQNNCVVSAAASDFALELSPSTHSIAAGSNATYTVVTKTTSGSPGSISLSFTNGSGITGSFSPASVAPGGTSTLTVSVDSSAANGEDYFSFSGTAGGVQRFAKGTATVSGGSGTGGGGGGGCPPGTIDLGNGICLPTGCSSSSSGFAWVGAFAVGAFLLWRRRQSRA